MAALTVKPRLVIDTREQLPYSFARFSTQFEGEPVRKALSSGDYSLLTKETNIVIERKSLQDLVNTVIHNRERFKRELARMTQADFFAIVVEATMAEVCNPYSFSQANPNSVIGSIESWSVTYGANFVFAGTRDLAEARVAGLLTKYWAAIQRA